MRESESSVPPHWYLYDLGCLILTGVCLWLLDKHSNLLGALNATVERYGLTDVRIAGCCLSLGVCAGTLRRRRKYRLAVPSRDTESGADRDVLTGLVNRQHFNRVLSARLAQVKAHEPMAVLLIDLDRFKRVNDSHGHAAGDAVLCSVADRLTNLLPPSSTVARIGDDEFAVMVDGADPDRITALCGRLTGSLARPVAWGHDRLTIGATIGVGMTIGQEAGVLGPLQAADFAMRQGKKNGRGTVCFYRTASSEPLQARAHLEQDLHRAIASGEIVPFFQPLVALRNKTVIGFEVLARWHHPHLGLLMPDTFIPVAEETGVIGDLFWSLLRQACRMARSWPNHLQLALNLSPQQLRDRALSDAILSTLAESGFPPERLELEITETGLIANIEIAGVTLASLRTHGVRIALDDFGTGYSSLHHLRELTFDKLKIDRSYVARLAEGDERAKLVDAVIALSRTLGMTTTAEGVETAKSARWLDDQGCTYGQGWLFGRPMHGDFVPAWLQAHGSSPSAAMLEDVAA